jgi:hypothetical protein
MDLPVRTMSRLEQQETPFSLSTLALVDWCFRLQVTRRAIRARVKQEKHGGEKGHGR